MGLQCDVVDKNKITTDIDLKSGEQNRRQSGSVHSNNLSEKRNNFYWQKEILTVIILQQRRKDGE